MPGSSDCRRLIPGQGRASGGALKKLRGPAASGGLSTRWAVTGRSRSGEPVRPCESIAHFMTLCLQSALYVHKSKRDDQAALKHRIQGHRRDAGAIRMAPVDVLLQRDGWAINVKRVYRLYEELSLQLRHKTPKRRVVRQAARGPNPGMSDRRGPGDGFRSRPACHRPQDPRADHRRHFQRLFAAAFRSRFSPAVDLRLSHRGEDVVPPLERICQTTGWPKTIRVDQGSEFVSRDRGLRAYQ
jgi:putative transposase